MTKHLGNVEATEKLVELCNITSGSYVLDVGCGSGITAAYLAEKHGCRVMGVDILPRMIDRAQEMAARGLSIYFLEEMGADWLPDPVAQKRHDIARVLVFGLVSGLILGVIVGLILGPIAGLVGFLMMGSFFGFTFAAFIRAGALLEEPTEKISWSWSNVRAKLERYQRSWPVLVLLIILFGVVIGALQGDLVTGLEYMLLFILTPTIISGTSISNFLRVKIVISRNNVYSLKHF